MIENKNIVVIRSIKDYLDNNISDNDFKNSVIVYCRVSTKSQIDGSSLDTQQNSGIDFYKNSEIDYKNIIVFREEGKSGDDYLKETLTERPLLQIVLNKIEKNLIKHFWVFDSSRLSRSTELSTIIMKTFDQNSCNYYINKTQQNFDELESSMMLKILTVFDEYENHKRFQKSYIGKIENMKKGKWNGGNYPFGYRKGDFNGHIIIDKFESKYVKKIFELFNSGKSIRDIVLFLNKNNVQPPKTDKSVWNEGTIRNILRSKKYIGEHTVLTKTNKHLSKKECIRKGLVVESKIDFPKLISKKLFNSVQLKMNQLVSRSNSKRKLQIDYLLNGIVYCGNCGNRMSINVNKKKNWKVYYCNYSEKKHRDYGNKLKKCGRDYMRYINLNVVEDLVWNEVLDTFKNSYIIKEQFKNKVLPKRLKEREQPLNQIKTYNKSIQNYLNKIDILEKNKVELYREKLTLKLTEKDYISLENSINDEINFCNNKIDEKKSEIEITNNGIVWYNWFEDFDNHYNLIKSYTKLEDKKNFINQFVDKITVYWDSISNTHKLVITFKLKIVKDQRIKEEKYVFKLQKGQNDKVISDINSKKYNKLINQKSKLKVGYQITQQSLTDSVPNYLDTENSDNKDVESILFSFDLIIRTSKLTKTTHYNSYQHKLYRLIKFLKEERGIGYRRISHILTEKGYRSVRTNSILKNNYIHSIYKKGKVRESRIERSFDSKIDNLNCLLKYSI